MDGTMKHPCRCVVYGSQPSMLVQRWHTEGRGDVKELALSELMGGLHALGTLGGHLVRDPGYFRGAV